MQNRMRTFAFPALILLIPGWAFTQNVCEQTPKPPTQQTPTAQTKDPAIATGPAVNRDFIRANYTKFEYRITMRDGVKLFASVYIPKDVFTDSRKCPILMERTPYSVPPYGSENAENINALISEHGFAGELGILSIDIDGNDYWVLDAVDCVNPAIVICEINGVFRDLRAVTVPYRPDFRRLEAHHSGQYFGCSLAALQHLCERAGYSFIGTNSNGVNGFFVRNDMAGPVLGSLAEVRAWAPRHRDSRSIEGHLDFVRGRARQNLVANLPVVDLASGRLVPLSDLSPLYSDAFLEDFR